MSVRIIAADVGVRFQLDRQQRPVTPTLARLRRRCTTIWALRGISFEIGPGAGVALVGPNGAGKTTLLRLMAGVLVPDEGQVVVRGRIGSLLSAEAGLMPALTGRENTALLGALAGLPRELVRTSLESISARGGLEHAFDRPVSTYSQGMRARLGFAVIEHLNPEVLLLDEVIEALDEGFRHELGERASEIRRRGGIVVAAGHDHAELARLCDRGLLLDRSGTHEIEDLDQAGELVAAAAVAP
jgi:ABC-type polysaccharide/polyol phosphate transport system ATPase subunit